MRAKPMVRGQVGGQKADAANQTKPQSISPQQQQHLTGNKMILTSAGTLVASPQQMTQEQMKQQQMQQQKVQQQLVSVSTQQQMMNIQQQITTYQQQQQQQLIQPKPPPVIGMAVTLQQHQQLQQPQMAQPQQQQMSQQQQQTVAVVERPVMSVTSMPAPAPCPPKEDGTAEDKSAEMGDTAMDTGGQDQQGTPVDNGHLAKMADEGMEVDVNATAKPDATVEEGSRERDLPKALVKPQVLTHVIEGYVIQEASEPFPPVNRTSLLTELAQSVRGEKEIRNQMITADEPPLKKQAVEGSKSEQDRCEACGKSDIRLKLKKGRRFCSVACRRKLVKGESPDGKGKDGWAAGGEGGEMDTNDSAAESSSLSPNDAAPAIDTEDSSASDTNPNMPKINPLKWTVSDVCEFIRALPGCCDYAEDFAIQEIDGQALMLLKEDHLMSAMAMKLGPALKICAKIDTMRGSPQPQASPEK